MSLWISDCNISPPAWISSAGIWSLPGDLYFFNFAIAISTSEGLGSGTNGSAVCVSISNYNRRYVNIFSLNGYYLFAHRRRTFLTFLLFSQLPETQCASSVYTVPGNSRNIACVIRRPEPRAGSTVESVLSSEVQTSRMVKEYMLWKGSCEFRTVRRKLVKNRKLQ
jgi:hypothetical protein